MGTIAVTFARVDPDASPAPLDQETVEGALADLRLGRVVVVPTTASTSSDLVDGVTADPGSWPDRSVLVADHQAAGRGRAGRTWTTPPGTALTVSVLLRPAVGLNRVGWVPLLAGLAIVRAIGDVTAAHAVLKWPNDVLLESGNADLEGWGRHRKVAGVLGDLVVTATGPAVVVGMGINVSQRAEDLPVPSATSLALVGSAPDRAALLAGLVRRLVELDTRWRAARGDAWAAGLGAECSAVCTTVGRRVRVEIPGGEVVEGTARALTADGALVLTTGSGERTVLAGDVRHVRTAGA
ncbi:MAG: biotin/acetyl-CoA-carboxylase ligase [Actinotalea sp.]|nr:biotin/acetyl-CoA-carboxylase ligase [Actinotalea sp.]